MIKFEYCQYRPDGCRHSSRPVFIKVVGVIKTRTMIKLVRKSKEPYCNDLCHVVTELPACPRDPKFLEVPIEQFPKDVRRWIEPKKKRKYRKRISGKRIARTPKP